MSHLPELITDLAYILGAAAVVTIFFKKIKQPVVLGYILVGLLVGPNIKFFPGISSQEPIKIWAEIGVIFLLFTLGLEFNFKKLMKVGGAAVITGLTELTLMFILGFGLGKWMGWPFMDCIFLGGIISISSTTIIFRAFEELGLKSKQFTSLVFGVLIVEDLVAILLMVVLSTVAVSQNFQGSELIYSIVKLIFFLCLWFLLGIFLLPTLIKKLGAFLNKETLLLLSIGLCLGMVVLANEVGFSSALGAFIMGSILSETNQVHKIEQVISSIKDLFGAIFFVSVGMLIDPSILVNYAGPVFLLTIALIMGKFLFITSGALLAGKPLHQSVQAGSSMTQIGEFSFIIATLGLTLGVISDYLYPIAVGVSVLTTFITPFMMQLADPIYRFLQKKLPTQWLELIDQYSRSSQLIEGKSKWRLLLRYYFQHLLLNTVVIIGIILLTSYFIEPFLENYLGTTLFSKLIIAFMGLLLMSPFIWALAGKKIQRHVYKELWLDQNYNHGPLVMLEIVRTLIAVLLVGVLLLQLFPFWISLWGTIIVLILIGFLFRQGLQKFYERIEGRFLHNLQNQQIEEKIVKKETLSTWDAHLTKYEVSPTAFFLGKSLEELQWREKYGINIAFIERGGVMKYAPARTDKIFPYDVIGAIGTDQQLLDFSSVIYFSDSSSAVEEDDVDVQKIVIDEHVKLSGKTIKESNIRDLTNGLVIGIERKGTRILNPSSDTIIEWDDVLWIVGNRKKISSLFR
ncbi:cation:proton antiporter [Flavobacterium sp.]|jgi:CPA2 family monovalent cation:H+ antiporter-2|uniref:cation:proton antiporter domain-containing protein n=1 Tax=Flavobacterium sp. TaxID=239 RepID=UPI0037BEC54C